MTWMKSIRIHAHLYSQICQYEMDNYRSDERKLVDVSLFLFRMVLHSQSNNIKPVDSVQFTRTRNYCVAVMSSRRALFLSLQSPLDRAQSAKNKGNKYFKAGKYENAIQCYTEAIALCPAEQKTDLSTFYQNRAAAYEQQVGET